MRDETIARSYAETLFELAERHEGLQPFGQALDVVARLLDEDPRFRTFLETPRIDAAAKKRVLRSAFEGELPKAFVNFLLVVIDKRRQRLLRRIAREFGALVDEHMNRVHVELTVARPLEGTALERVSERLSELLGKTAIPNVRVDEKILGGVIVRAGDTIYDGSLRRRLEDMRRHLLAADMPPAGA